MDDASMGSDGENSIILSLDALVRSIGVNKSTSHLVFLGSGASVSSGVPSAEQCVWEWKRNIFLTKNPGLEEQFSEISLIGVRQRIQRWFDQQGTYPSEGDRDEYGFYMEACFPICSDRRAYFLEKVRQADPHIGYRLLCYLAQMDMIRAVWTTNFDALVARAAAAFKLAPIEVGIDSQHRLPRVSRKGELTCVSLHGDFRYDRLKNTEGELQEQEQQLQTELVHQLREAPVIVAGYSGRDISVMDALREAYAKRGIGSLYWCGYRSSRTPKETADLIQLARQNGYPAFYVPT
ncbi:MAG: SIR2 family protein, partial [Chloroflexi bacterium]|nr:SIR2 family protein [Chloroflexota bacterium]